MNQLMGFFANQSNDHHDQAYGPPSQNKGSFGRELLAGAATFEALRMYENHSAQNGQKPQHHVGRDLMAAFAAGEVEKLVEKHGMPAGFNMQSLLSHTKEQANQQYDQHYGQGGPGYQQ